MSTVLVSPAVMEGASAPARALAMRAGKSTRIPRLAGAIAKTLRVGKRIDLTAVGVGANTVAIKAVASAREFLLDEGLTVWTEVAWVELDEPAGDGSPCTALRYRLQAAEANGDV